MANQFASIWAVKTTDRAYSSGDVIMVALKSGASKPVTIDRFLYETVRKSDGQKSFYHLAVKEEKDKDND
jgi:hypothetical protein